MLLCFEPPSRKIRKGCLGGKRREREQTREKSFQSCLLLLELQYAAGRGGYGEERVEKERKSFHVCVFLCFELSSMKRRKGCLGVERRQRGQKREKSFQSCLLLLELQYAAGRWNEYGEEGVEKERKSFQWCALLCFEPPSMKRRKGTLGKEEIDGEKLSIVFVTSTSSRA